MSLRSLVMLGACALAGCGFGSVSSFMTPADLAYDSRLLGTWEDSSGKESATIVADSGGYLIAYTEENGKQGRFRGALGRIAGRLVLEVTPKDPAADASDTYRSLLLPLHGVLVIDRADSLLVFRAVSSDSMKQFLRSNPAAIPHVMTERGVVLTAGTLEARRFLGAMLARPGVVEEPSVWRRRSSRPSRD